ncbi:MFS transporter [Streptomyces sp. NY05-11A]|uniref:MFS transporter n=1 Tax=Streptomyces soliscabiei TaxID=588897 RepID=UPI0029BB518B|nr:MFS transporter [Streptomyces sp. NY05-11A]MDX2678856.1 MFS transporter [Streptomyces sp. NY05-11A]
MTSTPALPSGAAVALGPAGRRGVLGVMCLALMLVTASMSALNLALPDIGLDLSASFTSLTWIVDAYTVALAGLVLPLGALGDRVGRRAMLLVGALVFGGAAFTASAASSTTALILCRVVMGLGAAMIMPGTLSTITAVFPAERRAKAVAVWSSCAAAGSILGLLVSGTLLEWFSWRSIFVTCGLVAPVTALAVALRAPESKDACPGRFDTAGAVCTALAPGALAYALIAGNEQGWRTPQVVAALAVAVTAGSAYVVIGLRTENPLLDPRLFRVREFSAGSVALTVQFMVLFGFYFVGLQYLRLVLGYGPLRSAVALVPVALVVVPTSQTTPLLVRRVGMRVVMISGLVLLTSGLLAMSLLTAGSGYPPFLGSLLLAGLGLGLAGAVGTSAITGSLPAERQGVASAANDVTREIGASIGIALMGSVFGSRYRSSLASDLDGLPGQAAEAVRRSPAGGLYVADLLGPRGTGLAQDVRDAFMSGMSAAVVAVAVVTAAAICFLGIGSSRTSPKPAPHGGSEQPEGAPK